MTNTRREQLAKQVQEANGRRVYIHHNTARALVSDWGYSAASRGPVPVGLFPVPAVIERSSDGFFSIRYSTVYGG